MYKMGDLIFIAFVMLSLLAFTFNEEDRGDEDEFDDEF